MKKELNCTAEFSSIFQDLKWLVSIDIYGFSSKETNLNAKFFSDVIKLVKKYNNKRK